MEVIKVKNIGPLIDVTLQLRKVNVIMGPQSCGKSTLAKIINFCQWMEKRYILDGEFKYKFKEQCLNYHRIGKSYFSIDSSFEYVSEYSKIIYSGIDSEPQITLNNILEYSKCKHAYIPAERNLVSAIPNIGRYKGNADNIMDFIYDWTDLRARYTQNKPYDILNLDISYFYDEVKDVDLIMLKNKKELELNYASTGLQSTIPILVFLEYLSSDAYEEDPMLSAKELQRIRKVANCELIRDVFTKYKRSKLTIEEPEQNLFPDTQQELAYYLLNKVNDRNENNLILTTHSPFILYAINNAMLGYLVKDKISSEELETLKCKSSFIDPEEVNVYEIKDGKIKYIQEEDGLLSDNFFDSSMKEIMNDYYVMLNYFEDYED